MYVSYLPHLPLLPLMYDLQSAAYFLTRQIAAK